MAARLGRYRSESWQLMRSRHLARPDCDKCLICDATYRIEVHHRRYPVTGQIGTTESVDDLITLCRMHHQQLHDLFRLRSLDPSTAPPPPPQVRSLMQALKAWPEDLASFTDQFVFELLFERLDGSGWMESFAATCGDRTLDEVENELDQLVDETNQAWIEASRSDGERDRS